MKRPIVSKSENYLGLGIGKMCRHLAKKFSWLSEEENREEKKKMKRRIYISEKRLKWSCVCPLATNGNLLRRRTFPGKD